MNKKIIVVSVFIVILFGSAIAETIFYFNNEIANLNVKVANLNSQISTLSGQIANLSSPYLVTALGTHEYVGNGLDYLNIGGTVINSGRGTAYNAGLLVTAYNTGTGALEINMTVPLGPLEEFAVGSSTDPRISNFDNSSLQLGYLPTQQTATIGVNIYHFGPLPGIT